MTAPARPSLAVAGVAGATTLVADQVSKSWAVRSLEGQPPRHVIGTLQLDLSFNDGVAFSLGSGSGLAVVPLAVVVIAVVIWSARSLRGRLAGLAVGLVVGGALGNISDRLFRDHGGAVVDFIDVQWWPVFNVADAGVVVGAILLALCSLRRPDAGTDHGAGADAAEPAAGQA